MAEDSKQLPPTATPSDVQITRAPTYLLTYSNQSRLRVSAGEVSITFAFADQIPGRPTTIDEKTTVVMSPAHAKVLAIGLAETIAAYEEKFGKIDPAEAFKALDLGRVTAAIMAATKGTPNQN